MRISEEQVVGSDDQPEIAPRREAPDLALEVGALGGHHIVTAPLETPAYDGEHGGALRCKLGIVAYRVFGEKDLHCSRGQLQRI